MDNPFAKTREQIAEDMNVNFFGYPNRGRQPRPLLGLPGREDRQEAAVMRVTPEMVAGIRDLVAKTPRGLRPVEVPGEVVHSLAEALSALGDLQAEVERLKAENEAFRRALPADDLAVMRQALSAYVSDYECVDPDSCIERAEAIEARLSALCALLEVKP